MSLFTLEKGAFFACDGGVHAVARISAEGRPSDLSAAMYAAGISMSRPYDGSYTPQQVAAMLAHVSPALLLGATQASWAQAAADDGDKPLLPSLLRVLSRWRLVLLLLQAVQPGGPASAAAAVSPALMDAIHDAVRAEVSPVQLLPGDGQAVERIFQACPLLAGLASTVSSSSFSVPRSTLPLVRAAMRESGMAVSLAKEPRATANLAQLYSRVVAEAPKDAVRGLAGALAGAINAGVQTLLTGVALEEMPLFGDGLPLARVQVTEALLKDTLLCLARCGKRRREMGRQWCELAVAD